MRVTIINDSSHCGQTGAAGWSSWIACDRGKRRFGGGFKRKVSNASVAETQGLINGLVAAIREGLVQKGDNVLLQTDAQSALLLLEGKREPKTEDDKISIDYFKHVAGKFDLQFNFRHVKGHSSVQDARSHTNRRCDEEAGKFMRKMRKKFIHDNRSQAETDAGNVVISTLQKTFKAVMGKNGDDGNGYHVKAAVIAANNSRLEREWVGESSNVEAWEEGYYNDFH